MTIKVMKNITGNFDLNVFKFYKKIIYLDIILIFLQKNIKIFWLGSVNFGQTDFGREKIIKIYWQAGRLYYIY